MGLAVATAEMARFRSSVRRLRVGVDGLLVDGVTLGFLITCVSFSMWSICRSACRQDGERD